MVFSSNVTFLAKYSPSFQKKSPWSVYGKNSIWKICVKSYTTELNAFMFLFFFSCVNLCLETIARPEQPSGPISPSQLVIWWNSYVDMKTKEECVCKSFQKGKMYEENNTKLDRMTVVDFWWSKKPPGDDCWDPWPQSCDSWVEEGSLCEHGPAASIAPPAGRCRTPASGSVPLSPAFSRSCPWPQRSPACPRCSRPSAWGWQWAQDLQGQPGSRWVWGQWQDQGFQEGEGWGSRGLFVGRSIGRECLIQFSNYSPIICICIISLVRKVSTENW